MPLLKYYVLVSITGLEPLSIFFIKIQHFLNSPYPLHFLTREVFFYVLCNRICIKLHWRIYKTIKEG